MHLQRLTLTNVRQFDERTFDFLPGFNLLVGENGAGKTTILRGLLAALGSTEQLGRHPRLEDDDIRLDTSRAEIAAYVRGSDGRLLRHGLQKDLWKPAKRSVRRGDLPLALFYSSNEALCTSMRMRRLRRARDVSRDRIQSSEEFLYELESRRPQSSSASDERVFGESRSVRDFVGRVLSTFSQDMDTFYWHFVPYDCSLLPPEDKGNSQSLDADMRRHARSFAMRKFQESWARSRKQPFVWPNKPKVVLSPEGVDQKREYGAIPALHEVWDGMEDSSIVDRDYLLRCSLEVKLSPRIMIRRSVGTLSLNQLSDGEQRLFSLFVDIARQISISHSSNALGEGEAIVLIDEVDVHLHPKWQRRIVPALEELFPNCQFIATTHSPFVIQATGRQRVIFIDPDLSEVPLGGGNSLEDIAEDIQGVPQPQRSVRAEELSSAAKRYFSLLKMQASDPKRVVPSELRDAEISYRKASEPFTSDPAIHALLQVLVTEEKP